MKLKAVDQRLEGKLKELYATHLERTAKIDWSYHSLIPWERGRNFKTDPWHPSQATISPELAVAVETALLTEVNLPWFTTGLTQIFDGSLEVLQDFVRTWTSEEDQHSDILQTYLLVTRNDDPDRLRIISAGANYGIAEYYRYVIEVVVRLLDIKNLHPTYPEAQHALAKLNRYLDSLARLAARADKQTREAPEATRAAAIRLLGL